jgi:hypothetical protein
MMMSPTTQRTISQNKHSLLPSSQTTSINSPISSKPTPKSNNAFKNKYDFILEQLSNLSSSNNIKSNNRNQHNISTFSNSDFIPSSYSTLSFHNKQPSSNIQLSNLKTELSMQKMKVEPLTNLLFFNEKERTLPLDKLKIRFLSPEMTLTVPNTSRNNNKERNKNTLKYNMNTINEYKKNNVLRTKLKAFDTLCQENNIRPYSSRTRPHYDKKKLTVGKEKINKMKNCISYYLNTFGNKKY